MFKLSPLHPASVPSTSRGIFRAFSLQRALLVVASLRSEQLEKLLPRSSSEHSLSSNQRSERHTNWECHEPRVVKLLATDIMTGRRLSAGRAIRLASKYLSQSCEAKSNTYRLSNKLYDKLTHRVLIQSYSTSTTLDRSHNAAFPQRSYPKG